MKRSGASVLLAVMVLSLSACLYGFAGGGLPRHIRTVAILPFENATQVAGVERDLHEFLRREVESRLGVRQASEQNADALVRGRILRYEPDIPIAYSANPQQARAARRRLEITVEVELLDQVNNRTIWANRSLVAVGEYAEGAEGAGRQLAIQKIVSDLIAGAQSQW